MRETPPAKRKTLLGSLAFPLFLAAILGAIFLFRRELMSLFQDRDNLRAWIEARGALGMLAFVGLQALQVLLFIIPGEIVQLAGGYVFGFWKGLGLSVVGITAGSLFNFGMGRLLGRPFVESVFRREQVAAIERVTGTGRAAAGFFLLFVIPGLPKDALCYVAGMSRLSFPSFLGISLIGRLPGIMGSSYMGSAASQERYGLALAVLTLASVLFFLGLAFKERIQEQLARFLHPSRGRQARPDSEEKEREEA